MGKEIVAIKHKNEDGIEEWIQKKKYSMCIWSVQKVSERMEAMRLCVVLALTVGYYITPDVINSINIVVIKTLILYTGWLSLALQWL